MKDIQRFIVVALAFCSIVCAADCDDKARLLGPFREKLRCVVFTKHFDMGGSHYAYTDAVSDEDKLINPGGVKKEFNFKPGSSLCMLSMDERLNVWETTLIHDANGVIRDPNGAHQQEFYGNTSYFPTSILHARGIPGTQKVLAILSGHHTPQKGKLAIIDPSLGREETVGVTLVAPEEKPKGLIRIDQYGQKGDQWQYPYPLDENNYLVTFRPNGAKHFGIYFMNRKGERVLLAQDPAVSCNQPVPLAPRPKPPQVGYPIDWSKTNGTFTVKDVYAGPGLKGIARGTVKKLRVVALDFMATDIGRKHGPSAISDLAAWDVKVVLGGPWRCDRADWL